MNLSKNDRGLIGLNLWKKARGVGTLHYVMRFGKTRVGLNLIKEVLTKYPNAPILILVPSVVTRTVWEDALKVEDELLSFTEHEINQIHIHSATTLTSEDYETEYKLVVIDEIHKFTTPERYKVFSELTYISILGLTGTYPIGKYKAMLDKYCPVIDVITEQEALSKGWISQFREYNIQCILSDEDKIRYERFTAPIKETLSLFSGLYRYFIRPDKTFLIPDDYAVLTACKSGINVKDTLGKNLYISASDIRQAVATFKGWHPELDITTEYGKDRNDYWHPDNIKERALIFSDYVSKRNEILINNSVKADKVIELIKRFPETTICFNESTILADTITKQLNQSLGENTAVVYHSNIESRPLYDPILKDYIRYGSGLKQGEIKMFGKTTLRNIAVEGLRKGTYKVLVTAKALDEGLDIPKIQRVITTSGTANPTQYAQRTARGKTVDIYFPDKVTLIFNLYFEDFIGSNGTIVHTRDKQKLINNQKVRNSDAIWIEDISNIEIF